MASIPANFLKKSRCWIFGSVVGLGISSTALTQDQRLTRTTKTDQEISILSYARSNQECEGIDPPSLYLDKPAAHGTVCFRASTVKLQNAVVGNLTHCIGKQIRGVTVVYIPQAGYIGSDETGYTVVFPQARHRVVVDMTVVSGQAKTTVSGQGSLPPEVTQPQGPLRACIEAVS